MEILFVGIIFLRLGFFLDFFFGTLDGVETKVIAQEHQGVVVADEFAVLAEEFTERTEAEFLVGKISVVALVVNLERLFTRIATCTERDSCSLVFCSAIAKLPGDDLGEILGVRPVERGSVGHGYGNFLFHGNTPCCM